jgi:hypothetical protein
VQDLSSLSPDLIRFFVRVKPVIRSAPRTLPHAARFLRGARPVLEALHPFLQELNPIVSFLNFDQQVIAHFLSNGAAALNYKINGEPNTHMLPQFGIINGRSVSFQPNEIPQWARGNAYVQPNTYDRAIPLGVIESASCENSATGGTVRDPTNTSGDEAAPPCFEAPPFEYDGGLYPWLERGEVVRKPPPNYTLRGETPANPNTHP